MELSNNDSKISDDTLDDLVQILPLPNLPLPNLPLPNLPLPKMSEESIDGAVTEIKSLFNDKSDMSNLLDFLLNSIAGQLKKETSKDMNLNDIINIATHVVGELTEIKNTVPQERNIFTILKENNTEEIEKIFENCEEKIGSDNCMICLENDNQYRIKLDCNHEICSKCFANINQCPYRCKSSINLDNINLIKIKNNIN